MKFGRRAFIQFTAGAVGGTLLSPLPWKLAGDSAKWSQNWSWRPSPERGEVSKTPTICTFCEGGCGIRARLVNGHRAILIEGNPANPASEGGVCPLAAAGLQFLYAPYRIAQPMKQTKKRGDISGLAPISWEEAQTELAKKLGALRGEGKPHTVACITAARQSSMDDLWLQFLTAYGSANLFKMPSRADGQKMAAQLTTGHNLPFTFALEDAAYVISFGANLFGGCPAPNNFYAAVRRWGKNGKNAPKLIQVESRCSMTASKADRWLAVAPGTEAALAMGIAHFMVGSGNYDSDFVTNNVFGFEDWTDAGGKKHQGFKTLVTSTVYSPDEVARKTGLSAAAIREIAKEFASQPKAVALWGTGQPDISDNTYHELAFVALNALKGNFAPGGPVSLATEAPLAPLPAVQKDALAERGAQYPRLDLAGKACPCPQNGLYGFLDTLASGPKYPINVLMVHEANPAYSLPENKLFQAALEKIGTLVSFSSYLDETAAQADLILPNHMALERFDDVKGLPGAACAYYAVAAPVLKPQAQTKHTGDLVLALAGGVGSSVASAMPWKTYEEFLKFRVEGLAQAQQGAVAEKPGVEIRKLKAGDSVPVNYKDGADLWKKLKGGLAWYDAPAPLPEFKTPSGQFELACQAITAKGAAAADDLVYLPHFAPLKPAGNESELPLLLVSYSSPFITNGYLANPPFMTKLVPDTIIRGNDLLVDLHPQTAQSLSLAQGARATLKTARGEATVLVNITATAQPGVVYIPRGLGHKAYDEYIQGKGVNANSLMEVQLDPVSGMGTVWATRAQLRRV